MVRTAIKSFLTTSSTATAESRQVGLDTTVKAADEAGNGRGVDTVATQDAAGETCTPICPQTTYKTKMEEYKDEKVILKRQMQEMQVSSGTGLLDLEHSIRCRQLRSDFDTSAKRQERLHTRTQQSMQNRQNSSRMEEESEQEQDTNALHQQLPSSFICYKTNTLQPCLHKLVFSCFSRENDKEATCGYEAVVWATTRGDFVAHCNLRRRLSVSER